MQLLTDADYSQGSLLVQWCFTPEEMSELREIGLDRVGVLFVAVDSHGNEVNRRFVVVTQLRHFFAFESAGVHTIHAVVMSPLDIDATLQPLEDYLMRKGSSGWYKTRVVLSSGLDLDNTNMYRVQAQSSLEFNVPAEYFTPLPPEWLQKWVQFVVDVPLKDQCDFRRRLIFAFTLQPFLMLLSFLIRLGAALILGVLLGLRGVRWKPVFSLLTTSMSDVWEYVRTWRPVPGSPPNDQIGYLVITLRIAKESTDSQPCGHSIQFS